MPKKSNKTAHVLSLLTNGGELPNEDISVSKVDQDQKAIPDVQKKEVIVELPDSPQSDFLSDLVKSDLEKELDNQLSKKNSHDTTCEEEAVTNERPPYSTTFMSKFGMQPSSEKDFPKKEATEEHSSAPASLTQVKSELYILEDFNDEDKEETVPMEEKNNASVIDVSFQSAAYSESTKVLHNLAEDVMKIKVPEIMKSFNMCACQDCVYDVMALALNHIKPLYTVTEKGQLFQKLASYELQYGTDLTSEITKACIKVKINPNHPSPNKK